MKFFYSAGTMEYGHGYWWHKCYKFPELDIVTKTLTMKRRIRFPFAIFKWGKSVFNKVSLHNIGFYNWINKYEYRPMISKNVIVSVAGTDVELQKMLQECFRGAPPSGVAGIEFNFSCPNVSSFNNRIIPIDELNDGRFKIYVKLNYKQDPYEYQNIDKVDGIRLNSIPLFFCGGSGKVAQEKNWKFIKEHNREGLNVAGCSFESFDDIKKLEDMGCTETGVGSTILTNPKLVEKIESFNNYL